MRTLTAALPALRRGEIPRVAGTRLAWIDGAASGGDAALVAAARSGHAADLGTVAEVRVGSRRALAATRAPQHVERDLLLIEAEGLAPIGLVLVLVGVRLFERAGRRHRKHLETIADAALRIGEGERDVALVAGRGEVGRVAGSLEHLAHGLRDLDRQRGLYVSQVSHDLRNPLAVIGTHASVLRQGERSRPRAAQLQTIEDEVDRLAAMVDDLLELGRTHALALHIKRAPADARAIVADAVARSPCALEPDARAPACACARGARGHRRGALAPGARQPARERDAPRALGGLGRTSPGSAREGLVIVVEDDGARDRSRRPSAPLRRVRAGRGWRGQHGHRALDRAGDRRSPWRRGQRRRCPRRGHAIHAAAPARAGRDGRGVNGLRSALARARDDWLAATGFALALLAVALGLDSRRQRVPYHGACAAPCRPGRRRRARGGRRRSADRELRPYSLNGLAPGAPGGAPLRDCVRRW